MEQEDVILIKKAKKDKMAFEALYKKYAQSVYNYFWYRVGHNQQAAEDLMQETFVRAFRSLQRFKVQDAKYVTYLLSIAHNLLVDFYASPKTVSLEAVKEVPSEVVDNVAEKMDAEALWGALQELSVNERDAILLRYRRELSIRESAAVMGKSENAVKLLLSRGRKKLASNLDVAHLAHFSDAKKPYTKPAFKKKDR